MKKLGILFLFLLMPLRGLAQWDSEVGCLLRGEHELRRIVSQSVVSGEIRGNIRGGFFLLGGGMSADIEGKLSQDLRLYFSWKGNDGLYNISSLPIDKVKISLQDKATTPTIKFRWSEGDERDLKTIFDTRVVYAVISCKPELWTPNFEMPLSKP